MFKINAVRSVQEKEGVKNIRILAFSENDKDLISTVLKDNGIIVMSLEEASKPLGNLYEFGIKGKDNQISVILPTGGKIRDAFKEFLDKFAIVDNLLYVRPYGINLSEDKLKTILTQLKKEFGLIKEDVTKVGGEKLSEKEFSKLRQELLNDVEQFITEAERLIPFAKENFPVEAKKLEDILGKLKKYKISTNLYKLAEAFSDALEIGEDLEMKYLNFLEKNDKSGLTLSLISDFEIISEYKTYKKVKSKTLLQKIDSKEFSYPWYETFLYQIFGSYWIHIKLAFKEILRKIQIKGFNLEDLFLFFQFLFLFIVLNYIFLDILVKFGVVQFSNILGIYYGLLLAGYLGVIFTLSKIIAYKNKFIAVVALIVGLILWGIVKLYIAL